ncbi:hypothetical protein ACSQ67_018686 [Phaseolus vulgaris]
MKRLGRWVLCCERNKEMALNANNAAWPILRWVRLWESHALSLNLWVLVSDSMEECHTVFGKYEMGRLLGKGTFAKVYYGKQISTGESVAIKVMSKEQVRKEGMMEQIKREISVMRLVRHPNVVELKEVMATKTKIFFVMEYVRGGELFSKISKGKLKEDLARRYFQQLISAIDYCHSRGVSHRDLKPENLLLDDDGNLKISDFGLSALPEQLRYDGLLHTQCGTPAYVAPEVLRKKGTTGQKPISGHAASFFLRAEFDFPPWFSPESKRLISKILVADPAKRTTISAITRVPWFRKGFPLFSVADTCQVDKQEAVTEEGNNSKVPKFFNAFEFISSMSSGFDLSGLFETKRKTAAVFTSKCSAVAIVAKIAAAARGLSFTVAEMKDFKIRLQGTTEGRKGRLAVTAEVFEVAPEVAVVEFSKSAGDTLEYAKFCDEDVRPALKDIVWTWQGDATCAANVPVCHGEECQKQVVSTV